MSPGSIDFYSFHIKKCMFFTMSWNFHGVIAQKRLEHIQYKMLEFVIVFQSLYKLALPEGRAGVQLSWGKGGVTPRTSDQFITGSHRKTNNHWHSHTKAGSSSTLALHAVSYMPTLLSDCTCIHTSEGPRPALSMSAIHSQSISRLGSSTRMSLKRGCHKMSDFFLLWNHGYGQKAVNIWLWHKTWVIREKKW